MGQRSVKLTWRPVYYGAPAAIVPFDLNWRRNAKDRVGVGLGLDIVGDARRLSLASMGNVVPTSPTRARKMQLRHDPSANNPFLSRGAADSPL